MGSEEWYIQHGRRTSLKERHVTTNMDFIQAWEPKSRRPVADEAPPPSEYTIHPHATDSMLAQVWLGSTYKEGPGCFCTRNHGSQCRVCPFSLISSIKEDARVFLHYQIQAWLPAGTVTTSWKNPRRYEWHLINYHILQLVGELRCRWRMSIREETATPGLLTASQP